MTYTVKLENRKKALVFKTSFGPSFALTRQMTALKDFLRGERTPSLNLLSDCCNAASIKISEREFDGDIQYTYSTHYCWECKSQIFNELPFSKMAGLFGLHDNEVSLETLQTVLVECYDVDIVESIVIANNLKEEVDSIVALARNTSLRKIRKLKNKQLNIF